mgnify:CR=1 FL=1
MCTPVFLQCPAALRPSALSVARPSLSRLPPPSGPACLTRLPVLSLLLLLATLLRAV